METLTRLSIPIFLASFMIGVGVRQFVEHVDRTTEDWCLAKDWPKNEDAINKEWCLEHEYRI